VGLPKIEAIGHRLSREEISPKTSSLVKLENLQAPKNKKDCLSLTGFLQWIDHGIPAYSNMIAPIVEASKVNRWTSTT
jgi:hypothetical protein